MKENILNRNRIREVMQYVVKKNVHGELIIKTN